MRNGQVKAQATSSSRRNDSDRQEGDDGLSLIAKRRPNIQRINDWRQALTREVKAHPARTAALALGAGYVLGGGLFSALTARLVGTGLRLGFRLALVPFVTQTIVSMGENLIGSASAAEDDAAGATDGNRNDPSTSHHKETHS